MSLSYSRTLTWTLNTCDVYVFHHPMSVGEWRNSFFFFLLRTEQNCRDKQTLPCKVKTQHLRWVLTYWFSLAAIGRRSKEDGAMCAGPRELGEIQAALCTPREWGLAYIECLCCRIESVEHLCLNSLTVKLGLTKNPSYTNTKWSRAFSPLFFFFCIKSFSCEHFCKIHPFFLFWWVFLLYMKTYRYMCIWMRWRKRGNMANRWRIMCWKRWSGGEWRISIVCLLKGRAHMGDRAGVYVD